MTAAQEAQVLAPQIVPSGQDYQRALWLEGIDTSVAYLDPAQPLPDLTPRERPKAPSAPAGKLSEKTMRWSLIAVLAVLLGALAVFVGRAGIGVLPGLSRGQATPRQRPAVAPPPQSAPPGALTGDLAAILAQEDRRLALVLLARAALARVMAELGQLPQPSWTLRDLLARVPGGHGQGEALGALVLAGERVLFGHLEVSEALFQAHLTAIRPLMERQG